jgi:hypothetical protein
MYRHWVRYPEYGFDIEVDMDVDMNVTTKLNHTKCHVMFSLLNGPSIHRSAALFRSVLFCSLCPTTEMSVR